MQSEAKPKEEMENCAKRAFLVRAEMGDLKPHTSVNEKNARSQTCDLGQMTLVSHSTAICTMGIVSAPTDLL